MKSPGLAKAIDKMEEHQVSSFTLRLKSNKDLESAYLHIDDIHQQLPNLQHSSRSSDSAWFHGKMLKSECPFFGLALDFHSAE